MALLFGSGNYINFANLNVSGGTSMAISAWVLLRGSVGPNDARVLSKGFGTGTDEDVWALRISQSADRPQFSVRVGGARQLSSLAGVDTLSQGIWHHLVGLYNNGIVQIWIDGVLQVTTSVTPGNIDTSADETWMGDQPVTGTRPFNGITDDVRVYDRFLGDIQIQTIFQTRGADAMVPELLYRWPCNDFAPGVIAGSVTDIAGGNGSGIGFAGGAASAPEFVVGATRTRSRIVHPFAR